MMWSTLEAQWMQTNVPVNSGQINCFIVHDDNLFAGTETGGVYLSSDKGKTWNAVNDGLLEMNIYSFCVYRNELFAGTGDGVFHSTNNGLHWSKVTSGEAPVSRVIVAANDSSLFSISNGSIYRFQSIDTGWVRLRRISARTLNAISGNGSNVIVGGATGCWYSVDNGNNFNFIETYPSASVDNVLSHDSTFIALSSLGIYQSMDNGKSWKYLRLPMTQYHSGIICGNRLFAGTSNGIYMSKDTGASWTDISDNVGKTVVSAMAKYVSHIFIATYPANIIWKRPLSETETYVKNTKHSSMNINIEQNYPNPFNSSTNICYSVPFEGPVTLKIYDLLGNEISTLINEIKYAGMYNISYSGHNLPSGLYLVRFTFGEYSQTKRLVLLK